MPKFLKILLFFALTTVTLLTQAAHAVEWSLKRELVLETTPLDMVAAVDAKTVYILVPGKILSYSTSENTVTDFIDVDKSADRLLLGKDNLFIVTSSSGKTLKTYQVEMKHQIDVSGLSFRGQDNAPVVIAVYSDYQCPFCGKLEPLVQQVLEKYPKEVKVVFKNFPLSSHKVARPAAAAALAAAEQGKHLEFHEKLFGNIGALTEIKIQDIARELNLDLERFNKRMQDKAVVQLIERDVAEAKRIGVNSTPSVFVNGRPLKQRSFQGFQEMIEAELKK